MAFKGLGVMTDNNPQARWAKIAIRQNVLDAIGRKAGMFDAFAGSGEMYSAVWLHAGGYVGCDPKPQSDARLMFCADNTRVLRAADLSKFSIFDFDSYGSPWGSDRHPCRSAPRSARRAYRPGAD
jgi:hypothetical protein